jgi:hypothetical protein
MKKKKGNKNRENFGPLKIGNLIQMVFDLFFFQNICKFDIVLFISSHRTKW